MIPIQQLMLATPQSAAPGRILLPVRKDRPPQFSYQREGKRFATWLAPVAKHGFREVIANSEQVLQTEPPRLIVDPTVMLRAASDDIPPGCAYLGHSSQGLLISTNQAEVWIGIDGEAQEYPGFEDYVAFPRWSLVLPTSNDDDWVVYTHDAMSDPA